MLELEDSELGLDELEIELLEDDKLLEFVSTVLEDELDIELLLTLDTLWSLLELSIVNSLTSTLSIAPELADPVVRMIFNGPVLTVEIEQLKVADAVVLGK